MLYLCDGPGIAKMCPSCPPPTNGQKSEENASLEHDFVVLLVLGSKFDSRVKCGTVAISAIDSIAGSYSVRQNTGDSIAGSHFVRQNTEILYL